MKSSWTWIPPGRGYHRPAVARQAGGAVLPRLLRQLLLSAAVHFLRRAGSVRAIAGSQPRRLARQPPGNSKDRDADSGGVAGGENHPARRLRVLPERTDELVRKPSGGLCVRAGTQSEATEDHRGSDAPSHPAMEPDWQTSAGLYRVPIQDQEDEEGWLGPRAARGGESGAHRRERESALCGDVFDEGAMGGAGVVRKAVLRARRHGEPHQRA